MKIPITITDEAAGPVYVRHGQARQCACGYGEMLPVRALNRPGHICMTCHRLVNPKVADNYQFINGYFGYDE